MMDVIFWSIAGSWFFMKWNMEDGSVKWKVVEYENIASASLKTNLLAIRRMIGPVECAATVLGDGDGRISTSLAIKDARMRELTSSTIRGM